MVNHWIRQIWISVVQNKFTAQVYRDCNTVHEEYLAGQNKLSHPTSFKAKLAQIHMYKYSEGSVHTVQL